MTTLQVTQGFPAADNQNVRPLTCAEVASLSQKEIRAMSNAQIAETIRTVRSTHLRPEVAENLGFLDRATLERLLYLTQRYCRTIDESSTQGQCRWTT